MLLSKAGLPQCDCVWQQVHLSATCTLQFQVILADQHVLCNLYACQLIKSEVQPDYSFSWTENLGMTFLNKKTSTTHSPCMCTQEPPENCEWQGATEIHDWRMVLWDQAASPSGSHPWLWHHHGLHETNSKTTDYMWVCSVQHCLSVSVLCVRPYYLPKCIKSGLNLLKTFFS